MVSFQKKICYCLGIFFSLLFSGNQVGLCQYYTSGTDPGSVKWRQINTPNFRLIYPLSFEMHAQYIANGLEYASIPVSRTIHGTAPKMPVILHNQTTIPSSSTPYAPRRVDFYTTPPQDLYPQEWVDQLIIHEFRHAAQYSAVNHGFTKAMSYILGEQGTFASVVFFLPLWFIEGDATVAETAFHYTGRGRTPSFEMRLRAQFIEKGIYSYEKANGGSYRDFVPGKYELGYQLVGLSRSIFGTEIWGNVLNNVGRRPYTLIPFSSAIKRQTGFSKYGLYDTLAHVMLNNWRNNEEKIHENNYQVLSANESKIYTSYNLPAILNDSLIISVKSSLNALTKVVQIDNDGKEKKLFTAGINFMAESFSASDSMIYWSEMTNDPRWTMRDYRVIKSFNYNTGKVRQITNCTRYYSPSVSFDGRFLATVEVTPENTYYLAILNAKDGSVVKRIGTPDNLLFIHPKWAEDGKSIITVVFGKEGNNIAIVDLGSGRLELLLSYSYMEIKRPSFWYNYIIYTASYNGVDNIYALDRSNHNIFQITSARFGASDACVTDDKTAIIYSNYTSDGYELVKDKLDPETWMKISVPKMSVFPLAEELTLQENFIYNADSVPGIIYKSKPYRKILNLINLHSWVPLGIDIENISVSPGITLLSQNLLGTAVTMAGYLYDKNQKNGKYFFYITDESLYPAIDFSIDYGKRHDLYFSNINDTITRRWKELNLSAGLRLPFKWTHNFWLRTFQPAVSLSYKDLRMDNDITLDFDHDKIAAINYSLTATNLMEISLRDIYPRWGQQLQVNFNNTPFNNGKNEIFSWQLTLDFPGIAAHHGLRLYGGYQKKTENYYAFSDHIVFPRGHSQISSKEIISLSALYSMPLFYPDWQLDHFLFIKRFKTSVFYDYAKTSDQVFSSAGLDLTMDLTIFNFIAPFDAGLRSAYIPETGKMKFEVLFAINLNSIY